MLRSPVPGSEEEETRRETRLKLILLAIALVLVAGYALMVTTMGEFVLAEAKRALGSDFPPLAIAVGVGAVVLCGLGFLLFRRARGRIGRKSPMSAETGREAPRTAGVPANRSPTRSKRTPRTDASSQSTSSTSIASAP